MFGRSLDGVAELDRVDECVIRVREPRLDRAGGALGVHFALDRTRQDGAQAPDHESSLGNQPNPPCPHRKGEKQVDYKKRRYQSQPLPAEIEPPLALSCAVEVTGSPVQERLQAGEG